MGQDPVLAVLWGGRSNCPCGVLHVILEYQLHGGPEVSEEPSCFVLPERTTTRRTKSRKTNPRHQKIIGKTADTTVISIAFNYIRCTIIRVEQHCTRLRNHVPGATSRNQNGSKQQDSDNGDCQCAFGECHHPRFCHQGRSCKGCWYPSDHESGPAPTDEVRLRRPSFAGDGCALIIVLLAVSFRTEL